MSIDNHRRHRGNDENDSPLLLELEAAAGEGDVVIGGKQGDQAESKPAERLGGAKAVETRPARRWCPQVWRGRWGGGGHKRVTDLPYQCHRGVVLSRTAISAAESMQVLHNPRRSSVAVLTIGWAAKAPWRRLGSGLGALGCSH